MNTNDVVMMGTRRIILSEMNSKMFMIRQTFDSAIRSALAAIHSTNYHYHIGRDAYEHNLKKADHATIALMQRKKEYESRNKKYSKGVPKGARKREKRFIPDAR